MKHSSLLVPVLTLLAACSSNNNTTVDATVDATDVQVTPPADAIVTDTTVDSAVAPIDVLHVDAGPDRMRVVPTEWPHHPPAMPTYSLNGGVCPTLHGAATSAAALHSDFLSGTDHRQFRLIVPANYDPNGTDRWPLIFAWHWLAGDSEELVHTGDIEASAAHYHFIVAVPDQLYRPNDAGVQATVNGFDWPFLPGPFTDPEKVFFDDMLSCITSQYRVDTDRIHGLGVSAGALWLTAMTSDVRAEYFASVAVLSGGLGQMTAALQMRYTPQPNKYPAVVLWGGPTDHFVIDFEAASIRLRDALLDDGHFVIECTHDAGHALPPLDAPSAMDSKFAFIWNFFSLHPYGLPPATSPTLDGGLPIGAPSWCDIPPVLLGRDP